MMIVFCIVLVVYPIQVAFEFEAVSDLKGLSLLVTVLDFICISDIILTFFTGYGISSTKEVILDPGKIARYF